MKTFITPVTTGAMVSAAGVLTCSTSTPDICYDEFLKNASRPRTRALVQVCDLSVELSQGLNIGRVVVYLQNPERIELQTRF
jgi:hypothetical protein